jgi:hypothetical protein
MTTTDASLEKAREELPAKQQKLVDKFASRARHFTLKAINEKMPQLADAAVNAGERVGGGLLGWGLELGTRALVDKLGQPAQDGSVNTFGKNPDAWKGGISFAVGAAGLIGNYSMGKSIETSMGRRVAANASMAQVLFGADRLATFYLKLPK